MSIAADLIESVDRQWREAKGVPEGRSRVGKRGSGGKNVGTRESGRSVDGMEGKRKMTRGKGRRCCRPK